MNAYEKLTACLQTVRERTDFVPEVALVLGSGLGAFADELNGSLSIDYADIEGFPLSTVPGHAGRFVFCSVRGVNTVIMQGRVHHYEGYSMSDVVLPIRLMGLLGAKKLLLTNAAGGVDPSFAPGDFMLITDHIGFLLPSPLNGPNIDALGTRFPDMSQIYDAELRAQVEAAAAELGIGLRKGVYVQTPGPQFESPAEVRMVRAIGGDAVGMSTACEAIAARHMGLRVCGISCISNLASGMSSSPLSHDEVKAEGAKAAPKFRALIASSIERFGRA